MLIQFSFKNFKSFRDEVTLDMTASSIKEYSDKIIEDNGNKYLKITAIYGANASGKSNVIEAFSHMKNIIMNSFNSEAKWQNIPLKRFAFNEKSKNSESMFEVFFKNNNEVYQYGFELDSSKIREEWLYKKKSNKSEKFELLFARENDKFELSNGLKIYSEMLNGISEKTLILSFLANIKIEDIKNVYDWFKETKVLNLGDPFIDTIRSSFLPAELLKNNLEERDNFNKFLADIDVGIKDIKIEEEVTEEKKRYKAFSMHLNNDTQKEEYLPLKEESDGTLKMISLYSDLKKCLNNGGTIFIDELDAKLHPLLSKYIVQIFHNKNTNPKDAQLIYTTHDVINLKKENFRRDEIWFVEKNKENVSELYSLVEYKVENTKVRNDASYDKDYLLGKYGALPILKEFEVGEK
ncbi:ATP-binding protein [Fusobacterium ulcerans]|uniref:Predicted ATPase n=1 Tax=Fusobacterium ulcerans TaxID=861 RepID=A0AAX2J9T4_9FUSO|nr:ATP-binding protein [Fusobacterium ulcerans]AVQ28919.1 ATP-binding protein [Fusobacterium ulcerans]EFS26405.1 hypothetical protein FUAG_01920 [Fusobacterium ulcerans ATCC 49185]SQJ01203.1 Predicted ATPase [Fusobacterium ulcerans]